MRGPSLVVAALGLALASCDASDDEYPGRLRSSGGSSGGDGTDDSALTASGSTPNELCFNLINGYREKDGLPPYERWTSSETCADGQAKSDAESGKGHGSFTRCGELAQNECPGNKGAPEKVLPSCLAAMWAEGPGGGHHDAMASTKYTKVACGAHATSRGTTWSVQNFR